MTRDEFCKLLPQEGVGIELGVAAGRNLRRILANTNLTMWGLDLWADRPEEATQAFQVAFEYSKRCHLVTGVDARKHQLGSRWNLVYVDLFAHDAHLLEDTLELWWHGLAPDGVMAGDDYCKAEFPNVVRAIDSFANRHRLVVKSFEIDKDESDVYSQHPQWILERE